ncbi:glycoside hydrolase family 3 N-terminal domain-containing protein [Flavobacterium sp.]|uniref:glycoside hydrolase family 3 N-terminal domain-containing protein n=1 Tax=Flavobacterium sp. TaxID=239 RepID=UPI0025C5F2B8|nr:glycoside hydrolase family 3 N-terminal domain-containing protein [Flavobacterium sp.]
MRSFSFILFLFLTYNYSFSQKIDSNQQKKWVDSLYNSMTFEEKVGQLFMVAAYSNKKEDHAQDLDKLIAKYKIGGLIFFQGGPVRQALLTNRFQAQSKIPMLIGNDAEWGFSMRLDSTVKYPWNMTLGAIQDNKLIEKMGAQMAKQSKRLGVHFTFGPVVDINTNPNNPIIGNRSFGEDKLNVTAKALAYMKGLQDNGIFATAKHFPGHGDTGTDSHHTLPVVPFDKQRLDSVELYPYKELIKNGLSSVMVAHLNVPSIESREGYPSSLSNKVVTDLLKNELQFDGLIFTDALNMKGASNFKQPGDIDLEAFLAGNDVLLFAENVPKAIDKFKEAFQANLFTEERLAYSVKKILKYKYQVGLNQYKPVEIKNLYEDLNAIEYEALNYQLYENAITVLKNESKLIPLKKLEREKIAYVKLGDGSNEMFLAKLKDYADVTEITAFNLDTALLDLTDFTKVIVGYHKPDGAWRKNELTFKEINWIDKISKEKETILAFFTKPYSLLKIPNFDHTEVVIQAYQNTDIAQTVTAEIIFGARVAKGKLPVTIKDNFEVNQGLPTQKLDRLGFTVPENVGMDSKKLAKIDSIATYAIKQKATPGMQILVARKGQIIYRKSFGFQKYDSIQKVKNTDIYDVASLTKVLATLPMVMKQYDKKRISLDTHLCQMLPLFENSNKADATLLDMLTHQARFQAWIPFYKNTLDSLKHPDSLYYRMAYSEEFPTKVANNLYLRKDYNTVMLKMIADSPLLDKKQYKYSDFSFIILKEYLERALDKKLDVLVEEQFYKHLGATTMTYNPLNKFESTRIAPTEEDTYFRYQTIQGYVHDMAAAMQGGVSGHAGLFSNSIDVAKMMQLYLQKGKYGDQEFFSEKTFNDFNKCYYCKDGNRRGVGFDKPQLGKEGPTCGCVSMTSFGHTGFTGTMAWADPEKEIVYVFLSNRTYPNAEPNKLSKLNIREQIQEIIYQSITE